MALTRQMLKAMGIEDDKIDQIIESHTESVDGLKKLVAEYREQAEKAQELEKKVEELSNVPNDSEEWKTKFDEEHQAFEDFKAEVEAEKERSEKTNLYRDLLREVGIDDKRIEAILKVTDIDSVEVTEGELSGKDELAKAIKAEWAEFIPQKRTDGASVDDPPSTDPNVFESMSLADKMQYANTHPGDPSVVAWLQG